MNLINPEKWSGVRSNIFSLLNPVFLMLTDPRTFSYGWLFGISIFAAIPFYFINLNNTIKIFTTLFIIAYYFFWFFTHQNIRYLLYLYPIAFSFSIIQAFVFSKQFFNKTIYRYVIYLTIILLSINGAIHLSIYSRWWWESKILEKSIFFSTYDTHKRHNRINKFIIDKFDNPKIISNQRDLYYVEVPVIYRNVWFDDIVYGKSLEEVKKLIEEFREIGATHLIYKDFNVKENHITLINCGLIEVSWLEDDEPGVRLYKL